MRQGIIILITNKDKTVIDNVRPITLINVDYKIFTHALASRLKSGMNKNYYWHTIWLSSKLADS